MGIPKVGDKIYVPSALYISRGRDDFAGGLATVAAIFGAEAGLEGTFVEVVERPGVRYAWSRLAHDQEALKARHGDEVAHADPDTRPEFNED